MLAKIEPSGCGEFHGNVAVRYSFYLEPDDARYEERYYLVPVIPPKGYQGKLDAEGNPVDIDAYNAWIAGLPHIYQLAPFHNHFACFDPDVTLEQIQAVANFHLPNFYAAWLQEWDKVNGGMRKGWAVETRKRPTRYDRTDPELYNLRKPQCLEKVELIKALSLDVKSKGVGKLFPATAIDIGAAAIDRASASAYGNTIVGNDNVANDTGTLDTVEIWASTNMSDTKVGTFTGSGTIKTNRDCATIGSVTAGSKQTFSGLSIDVVSNDRMGCYYSAGAVERDTTGFSSYYWKSGDQFGQGAQSGYTLKSGDAISVYGTGTTPVLAPTVTTQAVSAIGTTTATGNGNITATGGENCSKRGVCWNTTGSPTVADSKSEETDSFGTGAFTRSMTGLTPGQKYYVKAYAYNSAGYGYGSQVEFRATYDEKGKVQTILATVEKADAATFTEEGKSQTVVASHGIPSQSFTADELAKIQAVQIVSSSVDNQTMNELAKLQTTLVVIDGNAYKLCAETAREQVILGVLAKVEQLVKVETGREQVVLVALSQADLATFSDKEKLQLLLAVVGGNAYKFYTETERAQIILAVLAKGEQIIKDEVGREQVVLGVVGESDLQSMLETAKLQITLAVVTGDAYKFYTETGKEQIILTVQTEIDSPLFTEVGRTQTILAVITEADAFFQYLTALGYTLELHNSDGDLIAVLQNAHDISYAQAINSPSVLNFAIPADDSKTSGILLSNEIWLRDYRSGSVVKKFRLSRKKDAR